MRWPARRAWAAVVSAAAVGTTLSACSASYDPCWISDESMEQEIYVTTSTTAEGSSSFVAYDVEHGADEEDADRTCVYMLTSVSNSDQQMRVRITHDPSGTQEDFDNRLAQVEESVSTEILEEIDGHPIVGVSNILEAAHLFVDDKYFIVNWASLTGGGTPRYDADRAVPVATYIIATRAGAEPDGFTAMVEAAAQSREDALAEQEAAQAEADEQAAAQREAADAERVDPPAAPAPEATYEYSQEQIDEYNELVEGHGPFDDAQQYDYDEGYEFGYEEGFVNGFDGWGNKTDVRTLSADQSEEFFQGFDDGYDDGFADGEADAGSAEGSDEESGSVLGGGGNVFQDN